MAFKLIDIFNFSMSKGHYGIKGPYINNNINDERSVKKKITCFRHFSWLTE